MKKIIIFALLIAITAFASETDKGIVNITKNKYGTEMSFWPNTSLEGIGHVYSIVMNDCEGFRPSVTTKSEDRVLSWESLTKPKFLKEWNRYLSFFKNV